MAPKSAVTSLAKTCEAIANGRFDDVDDLYQVITDTESPEDIRALAESFAGMVVQVEAREFHSSQLISDLQATKRKLEAAEQRLRKENVVLRSKLQKYDVAYDKDEAASEVEKVAESEYFKNLQAQARSLRARFKST
ncbi:hypothetical protein JM93_04340 [Roseibium hamelinense]|uniref:Uncharacterized protein n=1 Tax=Roseibium hamelinense TaxID=150831 RepID=A0A562SE73_9HYPH|nr:hypothetical protein [Roseibium hamelinense]MTI42552.1 hypothetical protein [Roseibium hamelinense]TWI79569.1 hypothetical protein JM93_04340 [Roseibium hamelinense]